MRTTPKRAGSLVLVLAVSGLWADEGRWLYNQAPRDQIKKRFGFEMADGFYADGPAGELKCPGMEVNVLLGIEDVSARVNGAVKGYRNAAGPPVAYATDMAGLYARATGEAPYRLPERWLRLRPALALKTPLNFVSTADIIGGNSGSPTVNTRGEIVGIIYDTNLEAMPNRFLYDQTQGRAVHLASQGIGEALRRVYRAERLLAELGLAGE